MEIEMKKLLLLLATFAVVNASQMNTQMTENNPMVNQPALLGGWSGLSPIAKNEIKTSDAWKKLAYEHIDATEQQLYQLYLAETNQPAVAMDHGKVMQPSQQEDSIDKVLPVFGPVAPPAAPMTMQDDMMMNNETQPMSEVEKLYIAALQAQKLSQQEFDTKLQTFRMALQSQNTFGSNPVSTAPMNQPMDMDNDMMDDDSMNSAMMQDDTIDNEMMSEKPMMMNDSSMNNSMQEPMMQDSSMQTDMPMQEADMQKPMMDDKDAMNPMEPMAMNATTPDMSDHDAMMKTIDEQNNMMMNNKTSMPTKEKEVLPPGREDEDDMPMDEVEAKMPAIDIEQKNQ